MDGKRVPTLDTLWLWFGRAWGPRACISVEKRYTARNGRGSLVQLLVQIGYIEVCNKMRAAMPCTLGGDRRQ